MGLIHHSFLFLSQLCQSHQLVSLAYNQRWLKYKVKRGKRTKEQNVAEGEESKVTRGLPQVHTLTHPTVELS